MRSANRTLKALAIRTKGAVTNWGSYWDGVTNYPVNNYPGISGPPTSNVMAIAAGAGHDLALLSNGTVVSWGLTNLYPTCSNALAFQSNLTGVKAIASAWNHNVALLSNGVVKAWGPNSTNAGWNLTNVPPDLTNVVAISAFGLNSMALRTNGTVAVWGVDAEAQTHVPAGLSNVVAIAAGAGLSLALQANGNLVVWGNTNLPAYKLPTNMFGVKSISAGFQHILALASDGFPPLVTEPRAGFAPAGGSSTFSVTGVRLANVRYQWQFNGTNITGATNATLTLTGVDSADTGSYQVVVSYGGGSATSLAATFNLTYPPQIVSTSPSAGLCWITTNTTLSVGMNTIGQSAYPLSYQWQFNGTNIVGATNANYAIFNPVATNEANYTVVITNSLGTNSATWSLRLAFPGMMEAWGADYSGESDRPASLTNAAAIAAGDYHSTVVTDRGTITQWGEYFNGALVSPPAHSNYVATAAGMDHDIGLLADGTVVTWGCSSAYANYVPTNLPPVKAVACGSYHNVALLTNGSVVAWGVNAYGLTNVPPDLTNCTAIAANYVFSLALRANGTVKAWGYNGDGETNVPAGLSNVVAIAAGGEHCLALKSDGTVVAWGANGAGQCNMPAGLSNVMAIAAGWMHSVAMRNDGSLVEWGDNGSGQATVPNLPPPNYLLPGTPPFPSANPTPSVAIKKIAAGGDHTMAAIYSPLVQYQVDVTRDLLLIYNSNSLDSSNVCQYYLSHRPMVSNCSNVLGIGCTTNEIVEPVDFTNTIFSPLQNWLAANPTKRPQYVILFEDIPSRVDLYGAGTSTPSIQYVLNLFSPSYQPFITAMNMNGTGGTNDCIAYINKLVTFGSNYSPGQLIISASSGGYNNFIWYFDEQAYPEYGVNAAKGVTNAVPTATIVAPTTTYTSRATNVAGYFTSGWDGGLGDGTMFVDGTVRFFGNSGWYIMTTIDSFDGQRSTFQASFLTWFANNAFGGTNYSNTPVGAVSTVDEPDVPGKPSPYCYYGGWALGKPFGISAWWAQSVGFGAPGVRFQATGDPFVRK